MGNYTILGMFENPRRGRQARNFTTSVPKIPGLKSSSEQIFSENWRWVPLIKEQCLLHNQCYAIPVSLMAQSRDKTLRKKVPNADKKFWSVNKRRRKKRGNWAIDSVDACVCRELNSTMLQARGEWSLVPRDREIESWNLAFPSHHVYFDYTTVLRNTPAKQNWIFLKDLSETRFWRFCIKRQPKIYLAGL